MRILVGHLERAHCNTVLITVIRKGYLWQAELLLRLPLELGLGQLSIKAQSINSCLLCAL